MSLLNDSFCEGKLYPELIIPGMREFFNVISSLFVIGFGIMGLWTLPTIQYKTIYGFLFFGGIGSIFNHWFRTLPFSHLDTFSLLIMSGLFSSLICERLLIGQISEFEFYSISSKRLLEVVIGILPALIIIPILIIIAIFPPEYGIFGYYLIGLLILALISISIISRIWLFKFPIKNNIHWILFFLYMDILICIFCSIMDKFVCSVYTFFWIHPIFHFFQTHLFWCLTQIMISTTISKLRSKNQISENDLFELQQKQIYWKFKIIPFYQQQQEQQEHRKQQQNKDYIQLNQKKYEIGIENEDEDNNLLEEEDY
jgi:hypothetical protein